MRSDKWYSVLLEVLPPNLRQGVSGPPSAGSGQALAPLCVGGRRTSDGPESVRVWKQRAGFTLVEALIATALLALGLVPIAFMNWTSARESSMDRMELVATNLATELLEQVRAIAEGRSGVTAMAPMPLENPFPQFPEWVDVEERLRQGGGSFPLLAACQTLVEASRMRLQPERPGYHRYLQVMQAPLRLGGAYVRSPFLVEVRVRVDYGPNLADAKSTRRLFLDTLISHEDVSVPR